MSEEQTEDVYCVECKKQENDPNKLVTCMYCFASAHFKCRNIIGNAIRRVRENMYFCSSNCSDIYKRIVEMQNSRSTMIAELSTEIKTTVTNVVSAQLKDVKKEVNTVVRAIEESQQFLSSKFDDVLTDVQTLKSDHDRLNTEVDKLKKSQSSLKAFVNKLEMQADKANRDSIGNNAVILGIPAQDNEHIPGLVSKMAECVGVDLPSAALLSASRVSSSSASLNKLIPIRVVFKDKSVKELFFAKKRAHGQLLSSSIDQSLLWNGKPTYVAIRDELTPFSLELLQEVREWQKKLNLKYVWAGRDGVILIKRKEDSKPELIRNRNDLSSFLDSTTAHSSSHSPSPKRKKRDNE